MARRFNLDVDIDLGLEGYNFEGRFSDGFEVSLDFETVLNSNVTPLMLFSDNYSVGLSSDSAAAVPLIDDGPFEALLPPNQPLQASGFEAVFELSSLLTVNGGDGSSGFVINGIDREDLSGGSVSSAGDINGDGFDDIIIGASGAHANGNKYSGESYVIFGNATGFGASLELSSLDGSNGFVIDGLYEYDQSGGSVSSAGDINGDGFDDILIGAVGGDLNGVVYSGETYVVFGSNTSFGASLDLFTLLAVNGGDGSAGFVINGIDANDSSGISVSSAGDINGDGFDDILIGAYRADPNGITSGESYVVFGSSSGFGVSLDLSSLNGTNGFVINGIDGNDQSGFSVSSAGDINGDGFNDIIIGARSADPNGNNVAGESYIVFGSNAGFASNLDLSSLNGINGFVVNGIDASDQSGFSVSSAGDINGDGFDDVIIGARTASPNGTSFAGESYVIFGSSSGFQAVLELSSLLAVNGGDGSTGFVINGIDDRDHSGFSVSSAGDINGDGFDDIIIGARYADPNGNSSAGESYVVFGGNGGFEASLDLSSLDGSTGFVINGIDAGDRSGRSVSSAGDINGDGFDDIIIGAVRADPHGNSSGESYVIYGQASSEFELSSLSAANGGDGSAGFVIKGIDANDNLGDAVSSAGDVNGDGFDDLVIGASGAGPYAPYGAAGEAYIIFGSETGFAADFDASSLLAVNGGDGSAGFVMSGLGTYDAVGRSVSTAGDINGDGFDDVIIGAVGASPAGKTYVIFGSDAGFAASLDLSSLDGTDGFVINGIDVLDTSGWVSSAGDINGDGFDDIMIGANRADPNGVERAGETYVIFGSDAGYPASFDLSSLLAANGGDGSAGFIINGIDAYDNSGRSVSSAGDINGDGFDDIIIGINFSTPFNFETGESYIVFGSDAGFGASLNLSTLNGTNGFVLNGIDGADKNGASVSSAGDFNGDGFDDILIGANSADPNGVDRAGESYLVFGSNAGFSASFDLTSLNGLNGFVLNGIDAEDKSGYSVSSAGDINGDGFDDIIIGARQADPNGNSSGESYVVFGSDEAMAPSLDLSTLNGINGFVVNGAAATDSSGTAVSSAGDINGDGFDDLLIGALSADNGGLSNAGASYVIHGSAELGRTVEILSVSDDVFSAGNNGEVVYGLAGNDVINGGSASDVLFGDAGNDTLNGNAGNDRLEGGAGDDVLGGGVGQDVAVYNGDEADYTVTDNMDGTYTVTDNVGTDGTDTLFNIELLRFADGEFDVSDLASSIFTEGDDVVDGTEGDDILDALGGNDIVNGLGGNDTIFGRAGNDTLNGGAGNNTLNGDGGDDTLISLGNDILNGGTGNDIVEMGGNVFDTATATDGGLGFDTISFSSLAQFPSGNLFLVIDLQGQAYSVRDGSTILYVDPFTNFENTTGSEFGDLLQGDAGVNVLSGLGGDDNLQGRDGDDIVDGGAGADILNGGAGIDVATYASSAAGITAIMGNAALNTGDAIGDSYLDIENITGSDFDDVLGGDSNDNVIDGGAGFDIASYQASSAMIVFDGLGLVAASGDIAADTLVSIEAIRGTDFNDRFFGGNDASIYYGGAGADRLFGRNGDDQLYGEDGNDIILAGRDNDLLDGGAGNDQLRGNEGDDTLFGGDGNDALAGGAGADAMDGGAGIDRAEYTYGTNAGVIASLGNSAINTGDAAGDTYVNIENLYGTTFVDTLYGDANNNRIDGRGGDDMLFGGDGNDYMIGGAGDDVLNGEGGNDLLLGQAGADIYQFDGSHGTDRIIIFTQGEDLIEFTEGVFDFSGLTITQDGAHVSIVSSEGTIIVNNALVADFASDDFIFASAPPLQEPLDMVEQDMTMFIDVDVLL